jgi:hypothetical protein
MSDAIKMVGAFAIAITIGTLLVPVIIVALFLLGGVLTYVAVFLAGLAIGVWLIVALVEPWLTLLPDATPSTAAGRLH